MPKEVPDVRGWGCPQLPCSWLGQRDGPGLPGPALLPWGGIPLETHRELLTFAVPWQWPEHMVSISVSELRRGGK